MTYGCVFTGTLSRLACLWAGSSVTGMKRDGGSRTSCSFLWLRSSKTAQPLGGRRRQNLGDVFISKGFLWIQSSHCACVTLSPNVAGSEKVWFRIVGVSTCWFIYFSSWLQKVKVIVAKHKVCLGIFIYVFIYLQFLFQFRARFYEVHLIIGGFCHLEAIIIQVIQTKFFRYFNLHVATLYDFHFLPKIICFSRRYNSSRCTRIEI